MRMTNDDNTPRQAVVVADSFNSRFKPITLDRPRCLLPLVNRPLIDYTIEHLIEHGFYDITILARAHSEKIKAHLDQSNFKKLDARVSFSFHSLSADSCLSYGDAIRELSNSGEIRGPFVLLASDVISNMDLRQAMEYHQANKKKDKECIMTCIFKKAMPGHPTRGLEDDVVVCTNPHSNQLLAFHNANVKKFYYEIDLFTTNEVVDFHYDLMNTHVFLCEAHVPARFGDHFDIQDMESFIKGVVGEDETCIENIYIHILEDRYAARVTNLRTYVSVSQDIINRWTYPVVPDNYYNASGEYIYRKRGIYLSNSVKLYKANIAQNTVVGPETTIDRETEITDSVIGSKCEIGRNVKITKSFIWDEVTIEEGCIIDNAVLASGAKVYKKSTINPGCILAIDTAVGPNVVLDPGTKVTAFSASHLRTDSGCSNDSEDTKCSGDNDISDTDMDENLGADGWRYVYKSEEEDEDDSVISEYHKKWYLPHQGIRTIDEISDSSDSTPVPSESGIEEDGFYRELFDSMNGGYDNKTNIDHVILEINSSKHAYNVSVNDCLMYVCRGVVEACPDLSTQLPNYLKYFKPLLAKFTNDLSSQLIILDELQAWSLEYDRVEYVQKILHIMYEEDILDESVILRWNETANPEIKNKICRFITWLLEAEEESSEESD